ncbi:unnamed protein product [Heligmosomoides polygyrus]|uniref:Uncharacterized protein n=1 Tax=Heligmosomoides polygyrus TaxID=6339 RepID=A0A183GGB3_HELPZ|nr:unnamed protein product [Heligmosomoides polygyrus]
MIAPHHRSLICTLKIAPPRLKKVKRCSAARIKWARVKETEAAVISRMRTVTVAMLMKLGRRLMTRYVKLQQRYSTLRSLDSERSTKRDGGGQMT